MSTKVIKAFFDEERARKERLKELRKVKKVIQEEVYQIDQKKLDRAHQCLMNWKVFFPEDLVDYYNQLDQEEYEYILSKKQDFPQCVQEILWGFPMLKVNASTKLKVVDYTTARYNQDKLNQRQEFDEKVDAELAQCDIPDRPRDELDERIDSHRKKLKDQEEELEKIFKSPTKKYVAPSMRKQIWETQPEVIQMKKTIEKMKNEIQNLESYCETSNNDWKRLKRLEMREKIAEAMFEMQ